MWLSELEADRLRNLKAVSLGLSAGLTLVVGRNGQGKTSLLESIYLLATGSSFRTRRLDDLINWNDGPLRIGGKVEGLHGNRRLGVVLDGDARRLLVDGAERDLDDFLGRLDVVDLNGERMKVLRGGPDERRRFLDRGIVGLKPSFLKSLGEYRRVVQQRNALLREGAYSGRATLGAELDVWDERLVLAATEVHRRRREYAVGLSGELGEICRALVPDRGELLLRYQPSPAAAATDDPAEFPRIYAEAVARGRGKDRAVRHTCCGPHRDDLTVELNGVDLRRFGSAGQVRAGMIALKFGKLMMLQKDRGEAPLFLMDDFDSDLDEVRASALAGFLQEGGFQALVATSKENMASRLGVSCTRIRMDDGVASAA
ncbi:MAG: DNA replication and repair protein RecF [bacterium]|nr:DNA replication and repair protein RecF [bacterium]